MRSRLIQETRQLFLWSISVIFLFAFTSLFVQIPGLYGPNGLLPVYHVIPKEPANKTILEHAESLYSFPSILIYFNCLGLSPEYMMELCCVSGIILSFLAVVFRAMRCSFVFLLIWILYLSLHEVGQTFLYFQWDSLLLEAGFLTILVAPLNLKFWKRPIPKPHDNSSFWLVRWLLFRLMFASGVVKLTSRCPTWWGLTALHWHYESQCIPTPLSWYAHQLPDWFQSLSVVGTYYIEILVPFFFFLPVRSLRIYAFWNQVFFQLCIIATGNYNFFNLLTLTLCVSLLDDMTYDSTPFGRKHKVPMDCSRKVCKNFFGKSWLHAIGRFFIFCLFVGVSIGVAIYLFAIRYDDYRVLTNIVFSEDEFFTFVKYSVYVSAAMGGASLVIEILHTVWECLSKRGLFSKIWSLGEACVMCGLIVILFLISLMPLSYLDRSFNERIPSEIQTMHNTLQPLHITSSYGLFRRMTGVGGRPELIIEGANNEDGPWREYEFLFKPGHPSKPLPLVAPHQPRLDWQMWFAALGSYEHNPWLVNLVHRLLVGQSEVLELMAPPPFERPPKFIRVQKYLYHFTKYDFSSSLWNQSGPWWKRTYQHDYLFSLSLGHSGLQDYLKKMNLDTIPVSSCDIKYVCSFIDQVRDYSRILPPTELCLALVTTATIIQITLAMMSGLMQGRDTPIAPLPQTKRHHVEAKPTKASKQEKTQPSKEKKAVKRNKKGADTKN